MKKLCIVTRSFPDDCFGGGENLIYNIWKRACRDYDVTLISGWKRDKRLLPAKTYSVRLNSKSRLLDYIKLNRYANKIIQKIKPDIVHISAPEVSVKGCSVIYSVYHVSHLIGNQGIFPEIQKFFLRKNLKKAEHIITISKTSADDMNIAGISSKNPVSIIPVGIDIPKLKPQKKNEKFTILIPSRISPEKGQHVALEALRKSSMKDYKVIVAGFVSDRSYYKSLKDNYKSLPVMYVINPASLDEFYRIADLVIFPTAISEGFGIIATEALAYQKPLIASDYPAIREAAGNHALYFTPKNPESLREQITYAVRNYAKVRALAKKATPGLRKLDWENIYAQYRAIYGNVLREGKIR